MDRKRITALADYIEQDDKALFYMEDFLQWLDKDDPDDMAAAATVAKLTEDHGAPPAHFCGTAACIAGYTVLAVKAGALGAPIRPTWDPDRQQYIHFMSFNCTVLDIDGDTATTLFTPSCVPLHTITRAEAVRTLRHLAETGVVDWRHCTEHHDRAHIGPCHTIYEE